MYSQCVKGGRGLFWRCGRNEPFWADGLTGAVHSLKMPATRMWFFPVQRQFWGTRAVAEHPNPWRETSGGPVARTLPLEDLAVIERVKEGRTEAYGKLVLKHPTLRGHVESFVLWSNPPISCATCSFQPSELTPVDDPGRFFCRNSFPRAVTATSDSQPA